MRAQTLPPAATPRRSGSPKQLAHLLLTTALIVVALGVLPIAWDVSVVWQVMGSLVAVSLVVHTAQVVWREVFSTRPRHLGTSG
jgi:hypothetical protein